MEGFVQENWLDWHLLDTEHLYLLLNVTLLIFEEMDGPVEETHQIPIAVQLGLLIVLKKQQIPVYSICYIFDTVPGEVDWDEAPVTIEDTLAIELWICIVGHNRAGAIVKKD